MTLLINQLKDLTSKETSSLDRKILLMFLYYALFPNFIRLLFGSGVLGEEPLKSIIALVPFVLSLAWLLVKISPDKTRLERRTLKISPLGALLVLFSIILIRSFSEGVKNENPHRLGDIAGWTILLGLCFISYFSINDTSDISRLIKRITPLLLVMSILQLVTTGFLRVGINTNLYPLWTDTLLLFFSLWWHFSQFILAAPNSRHVAFHGLLTLIAILIQFSKPMLWSLFSTLIIAAVISIWLKRFDRTVKTVLSIIAIGIVFSLLAELASTGYFDHSLLETFTQDLERNFLKIQDPLSTYQGDLDGGRLAVWELTIQTFEQDPWLGQGARVWYKLQPVNSATSCSQHDFVLTCLYWTGWICFSDISFSQLASFSIQLIKESEPSEHKARAVLLRHLCNFFWFNRNYVDYYQRYDFLGICIRCTAQN